MDDRGAATRRRARLGFRGFSTLATAAALAQPVLAGGFLQGHYDLLGAHRTAAVVLTAAVLLALVAAGLMWRPGRDLAGREAVLLSLVALLVVNAQIALGFQRELVVHIPLGIAVLALVGRMAWVAWRTPLPGPGGVVTVPDQQAAEVGA